MHTFVHIVGVNKLVDQSEASEILKKKFEPYLSLDSAGTLWFGAERERIELHLFEWKQPKSMASMVLKLLHKPANVAETIYDLLGVRIVTKNLKDKLLVLKLLNQFDMVSFPNLVPSRSRNTSLDLGDMKGKIDLLIESYQNKELSPKEFADKIDLLKVSDALKSSSSNPHSSSHYKSMQLTCRQLVRTENQTYRWIAKLASMKGGFKKFPEAERQSLSNLVDYVVSWPGLTAQKHINVFFPFEVQILDHPSYGQAKLGEASHDQYKKSQLRAARRRVVGEILKFK